MGVRSKQDLRWIQLSFDNGLSSPPILEKMTSHDWTLGIKTSEQIIDVTDPIRSIKVCWNERGTRKLL